MGVDNGLRSVDICNLTLDNAREFLETGESEIRGKGRNGGSMELQMLNKVTGPLLKLWMRIRASMVAQTHTDCPNLLCRIEHRQKGDRLVPLS